MAALHADPFSKVVETLPDADLLLVLVVPNVCPVEDGAGPGPGPSAAAMLSRKPVLAVLDEEASKQAK